MSKSKRRLPSALPLFVAVGLLAVWFVAYTLGPELRREGWANLVGLIDRRPSYPLVTGDGFRDAAQHVCDETGCFIAWTPWRVRDGDAVFVKADLLEWYLRVVAAHVKARHVVVAHNGDAGFDAKHHLKYLSSPGCASVSKLFVQNIDVAQSSTPAITHPRLASLPIGIENRQYKQGRTALGVYPLLDTVGTLTRMLRRVAALSSDDVSNANFGLLQPPSADAAADVEHPLLLAQFDIGTNPRERTAAALAVAGKAWATVAVIGWDKGVGDTDTIKAAIDSIAASQGQSGAPHTSPSSVLPAEVMSVADDRHAAYLTALSTHPFTLSPAGNGAQSHRTWEALLAGSVPIVRRTGTAMDRLYDGLPVVMVDEWSDATRDGLVTAGALMYRVLRHTLQQQQHQDSQAPGKDTSSLYIPAEANPFSSAWFDSNPTAVFHLERLHADYWASLVGQARREAGTGAAADGMR